MRLIQAIANSFVPSVSTWTLEFNNLSSTSGYAETNELTVPENVTIYVDFSTYINFGDLLVYIDGVNQYSNTDDFSFSINAQQGLKFSIYTSSYSGTITLKETNSTGRILGDFTVSVTGND